jgi:hypothetical protein
MNSYRRLEQSAWLRVRRWCLRLAAAPTGLAGAAAVLAGAYPHGGVATSLTVPLALAGIGLLVAAALMLASIRSDLIELILGGLAGGAFGVTLAEMSAQATTIENHYKSLWVPVALAVLLVAYLASGPTRRASPVAR